MPGFTKRDGVNLLKAPLKKILPQGLRVSLRLIFYFGAAYRCALCNARVRTLLPAGYRLPVLQELDVIGGEYLDADCCPVCLAHGRVRLVYQYLRTAADFQPPCRVLHIAPEPALGRWLKGLPRVDYVPGDLNPRRYANLGIGPVAAVDLLKVPFSSDEFDVVICNHVLEHVFDDRRAMAELFRVLKPGGWSILQVPMSAVLKETIEDPTLEDPRERERRFGQHDHISLYGADYKERLAEAGFSVEIFDPAGRWQPELVSRLKLNPREKVFIARKHAAVTAEAVPAEGRIRA